MSAPRFKAFNDIALEPKVVQGSWTDTETIALFVCQHLVKEMHGSCSNEDICCMYNLLESQAIRSKSSNQVRSKLGSIKREFFLQEKK